MTTQNAIRDQNYVTSKLAVLNTDTVQGTSKVQIALNQTTGAMAVNTASTISFTMVPIDVQDSNYVDCLTWTGSDGLTYPWVADSNGAVLIST